MQTRSWPRTARLLGIVLLLAGGATAGMNGQTTASQVVSQIHGNINEAQRITLTGDLHPLARAEFDQGAVAPSKSAGRLMLVLKRSSAKQTALNQFLADSHNPQSASFHRWITPEQFGSKFGPSKSDLRAASTWLQSHGLTVAKVHKGGSAIEFTGTVGQINEAFHTSIHAYKVNGEIHHANATDPQIPAALANLVAGVTQLNDFNARPMNRVRGKVQYSTQTHVAHPQWTVPASGSTPTYYLLTPEDFAVQYDAKPAYTAGITGTGATIGILSDSNIDISVVNHYRSIFGLPVNPPQVVIDGSDPGVNDNATEAYLDVENAGAVAPNATIILYTSGSYGTINGEGGVNFSMARAIEDNTATILSLSYGNCEQNLGNTGNTLINEMWEQAAAQGQTVLVSSGDTGSAGCDSNGSEYAEYGRAVNGLASTPWNIAVGGTDAYYSDYATGGASLKKYWKSTNDAKHGSLQKAFPEQSWNNSIYGHNLTAYDPKVSQEYTTASTGGGVSSCVTSTSKAGTVTCTAGWSKPAWQKATGVPADKVRDIPDVSLLSADGANGLAWAVCVSDTDCVADSAGNITASAVGGTSASAPAMAGILALINQKYGAQGQANFILYPMATQYPKAFNDISIGSNNVPCDYTVSQCWQDSGAYTYSLQKYSAGKGYDLATGLGTVDVNNLITNWGKISMASTKTALTLSKTTITHGQSISAGVKVTSSTTGTPTGGVTLLATTPLQANTSQTLFTLNSKGTATQSVDFLPGGSYSVYARYGGDGFFGSSQSTPISVTVAAEACSLNASIQDNAAAFNGYETTSSGAKLPYGVTILADIQPSGISAAKGMANGVATGTATYMDGKTILGTVPLNNFGGAEYTTETLGLGAHSLSIAYSGDASFKAATTTPLNFTVVKSDTFSFFEFPGVEPSYYVGQPYPFTVAVDASSLGPMAPTGTVSFKVDSGAPVKVALVNWNTMSLATYAPSINTIGRHLLTATYSGDTHYNSSTVTRHIQVDYPSLKASSTKLTVSPSDLSSITPNTKVTITATVTGGKGSTKAPTGTVAIYDAFMDEMNPMTLTAGKGATSTASISFTPSEILGLKNALKAVYSGDSVYNSSTSNLIEINNSSWADFLLVAQSGNVSVAAGSTAAVKLNLTSEYGFSNNVVLTCKTTTGIACAVAPSTVKLSGKSTASVTINAYTQSGSKKTNAPVGSYVVLVTGTSTNGIVHNARINAIVK
jgi:hypothetical protein